MECYVFVDDSNLWIEGMKAQGKKLKDADIDNRYRIDLGKFLKLVVAEDRHISKAFLYGSFPPPNDTVWKAAREKNFDVKIFQRSGSGREKEVDVAMTTDILNNLHRLTYTSTTENVVFITVTGDRDLKIPIEEALNDEVPVELWSWEEAMSREFRQMGNTHPLFTANTLDSVKKPFGYTAVRSTRDKEDIDPAHAIVYNDVPGGKAFLYVLADHITRLMRLFYITCIEKGSRQDLIVEFPNSKPKVVLRQLKKFRDFEYQPCSYPEYKHELQQQHLKKKNRFEALGEIESLLDAVESSMSLEVEEISSDDESSDGTEASDDWATEVRRKVGKMTHNKKRQETPCIWRDHCAKASECPYLHTDEEKRLFARLPHHIQFKYYKARKCNKIDQHVTADQRKRCAFAHDNQDSWCLKCKMYGHLTDNCLVK